MSRFVVAFANWGRERRHWAAGRGQIEIVGQLPARSLVIDDVATTGITIEESLTAIRKAGGAAVGLAWIYSNASGKSEWWE